MFLEIGGSDINPIIPSTLIGLIGLIAGYVYYYLKQKNNNELKQIQELSDSDKPKFLEQKLNDFGTTIDSSDLSPEHKYDLLKRLMNNKLKKYLITALTLVSVSVITYLVWDVDSKSNQEKTENYNAEETINSFSFSSGNSEIDELIITKFEADSFIWDVVNPTYEIIIYTEPTEEPIDTNGSIDGFDYYYAASSITYKINLTPKTFSISIPETSYKRSKIKAKNEYKKELNRVLKQNLNTIYNEIIQNLPK